MTPEEFEKYLRLFLHRQDVFAEQGPGGSYFPVRQAITPDDVQEHLAGFSTIGTYVLDTDNTVKYAVFDLDTLDEAAKSWLISCVTKAVLELSGGDPIALKSCLLEFSGGKGHHAWVFFDQPAQAASVREWATASVLENWKERASDTTHQPWPLELFPKQDSLPEGGFGNLVKLPLGLHRVSDAWSSFEPVTGWAADVGEVEPLPARLLPVVVPEIKSVSMLGEAGVSPFPCVNRILRGDVPQGNRDRAIFHLALYCFGHGLERDIALEVCKRANARFPSPLRENEVSTKVGSAYTGRHPGARCGGDWLESFCPGPCQSGKTVGRGSGGDLRRCRVGDSLSVSVAAISADGPTRRVVIAHEGATNRPTFVVNVD